MKYYEIHDDIYKDLKRKKVLTWDGEKDMKNILDSEVNHAINERISNYFPETKSQTVLDLGTGTGNSALFLATKGFKVTGYDLSETAIEMAKENASVLDLDIDFFVQDIVKSSIFDEYNLVVDSSFLHCIVFNDEREKIYQSIRKALKKKWIFLYSYNDTN